MLRIGGWHSHILGGIKLQVREADAEDAFAILRDTASLGDPQRAIFQEGKRV